jgi:hypothetical protein
MLLAEALARHGVGRRTRPPATQEEAAAVVGVARLFLDGPSAADHPFSIHSICRVGAAHGWVLGWVAAAGLQLLAGRG